jgi:hypothetical protein
VERPQGNELLALAGLLDQPALKELLRSIFAEEQVACMKFCNDCVLAGDVQGATKAAARGDAFGDACGILQNFVYVHVNPEEPDSEKPV